MLAGKSPAELNDLTYPVLVSPKLDGVRVYIKEHVVYSRTNKPIPNRYIQEKLKFLHGYDGEIIVGNPTDRQVFHNTTSAVMRVDGEPQFTFFVFDSWQRATPFDLWYVRTRDINLIDSGAILLSQKAVINKQELLEEEEKYIEEGFEGIMIRKPNGEYKNGRSTTKEGLLLKLKRFMDGEAEWYGIEQEVTKGGELKELTMGAMLVRDLVSGVEFKIGTGFSAHERKQYWSRYHSNDFKPCIVRYKHFLAGAKDKPRFPVFNGERHPDDI